MMHRLSACLLCGCCLLTLVGQPATVVRAAEPEAGKSPPARAAATLPAAVKTAAKPSVVPDPPPDISPAAPAAEPPSPELVQKWIRELGDNAFAVREAAGRQLQEAGSSVVEALAVAATGDNLEVTSRAIRILQTLYHRGDDQAFDAAETVLERLATSDNASAARRASAALGSKLVMRHKRAIARIQLLGGLVKYVEIPNGIVNGQNGEPMVAQVWLGKNWKGGDAGLVNVRRLNDLKVLYIIAGANVSEDALKDLQAAMPNLSLQFRGAAMLGIGGENTTRGCQVSQVSPNSGAEKAELQVGDAIVKYDGHEVKTFEQVIELTKSKNAGDKVKLGILRNGELIEVDLTLGGWEDELSRK